MSLPYRAVTFDCFGTLIDWRTGMERVLLQFPSLRGFQERIPEILEAREKEEQKIQAGPYRRYADILSSSIATAFQQVTGQELTASEQRAFAAGQLGWPAFPDTPAALRRLAAEVPVGLLSNCDAQTLRICAHKHLGAPISLFVSAEEVQSYKPAPNHWGAALAALDAQAADVLHVSFTPEYDLNPAAALGFPLGFIARYDTPPPPGVELAVQGGDLADFVDRLLAG